MARTIVVEDRTFLTSFRIIRVSYDDTNVEEFNYTVDVGASVWPNLTKAQAFRLWLVNTRFCRLFGHDAPFVALYCAKYPMSEM